LQLLFEAVASFDADVDAESDLDVEAATYVELQTYTAKHLGNKRGLLQKAVRAASLKVTPS
jgi:hypothetical protein